MGAPYTELEKPLDEYAMLCRGCLAESGEMKNMQDWGLAEDFYDFSKIQDAEGYPKLLCSECEESLQSCRRFRLQCQNSDYVLQTMVKKKQNAESQNEEQNSQENTISCVLYDKKLIIMITAPNMDAKIYLSCPYCQISYIKAKDLKLHLFKNHEIAQKDFSIELQYYCSVKTCSYYINSGKNKHFQGRKFLNQHYKKVHSNITFMCSQCSLHFPSDVTFNNHFKTCNVKFTCQICDVKYNTHDRLLVHLMRKHPEEHVKYKTDKKLKRKATTVTENKKTKLDNERFAELTSICDSPKRSFATQTATENIKNDVALPSWHVKGDTYETKTDEISTQTGFEDLLSLKSQTSEDESFFFSENVSLSDIQTQTFPIEFGLSRSNKKTLTSETQSPDLSIKETQTCVCLYDSPKMNFKLFDSVSSSPCSLSFTTSETQTNESKCPGKSDVLLSFNSAQTQTSFEDCLEKSL